MEDLWAFNEEIVARAIYVSNIPVISAVGHEPDVTIADYVADLRAATPSNGAELAVPDQNEIRQTLDQLQSRMAAALRAKVSVQRQRLERLRSAQVLRSMCAPLDERRMWLEMQRRRMAGACTARISGERTRLAGACAGLDAMSPLKVLARGYAVARGEEGVISSVEQAAIGDEISVLVTDGALRCRVEGKEKRKWRQKNS